ncbi:MAG TPA: sulfur carrier protein ThiS [Gammaproteobacteria bacterium]|nr:sulfur carrier protein ThiS [Gammaproteobacteria bacterium]
MHILLNGATTPIAAGLTAGELIRQLDLAGKRIALEVNGEIVPRSSHAEFRFNPDDKVEIVHAIGGG